MSAYTQMMRIADKAHNAKRAPHDFKACPICSGRPWFEGQLCDYTGLATPVKPKNHGCNGCGQE